MSSKGRLLAQAITESRVLSAALTETAETPSFPITKKYTNIDLLPSSGTIGDIAFVESTNRLYIWNGNGWYNIALINTNPSFDVGGEPESSYLLEINDSGYISPLTITLLATDPEGLPIQYSALLSDSASNFVTVAQDSSVFTITPKSVDSIGVFDSFGGEFSITFRASDGVNLATVLSEFTVDLRTVTENSRYTTLMLKTTGVDGATNNTFVDGSTNNFTITRNGNTTQGAFSPYGDKWGNYFNENYLSTPSSTGLSMGTSNFTFEIWYYPTDRVDPYPRIFQFGSANWGSSDNVAILDRHDDANTKFGIAMHNLGGNAILLQSNTTVTENIWYHIALSREGNTFRLFINGILEDTYTNSGSISTSSSISSYIGGGPAGDTKSVGYISDLRIVKGSAIYTSNFTPPTEPLTAVTGTSLLTCQSNRFKDSSVNNFTLTKSGDVKVTKFSPYDQSDYNASTLGGSAYFDGAGDFLVLPEVASTSGDVTIEFWINPSKIQTYNGDALVIGNNINGLGTWAISFAAPTNKIGVWLDGYGSLRFVSTATVNRESWNHIALVKTAGIIYLYINGIQESTTIAQSANFGQGSNVYIGEYHAGGQPYTGYVSDVRVVNGTALYTSNFTPPTGPLTAVANTSLLCNFTNAGIFDASTKSVLETVGNAQVDTAVTKFGTGSVYFDGTGDWLTFTGSTSGAGDFTTEAWVNLSVLRDYNAIFDNRSATSSTTGYAFGVTATGASYMYTSGTIRILSSVTIAPNTWNHLALVRSGTTITLYVNGVSGGTYTSSANFSDTNNGIGIALTYTPTSQYFGYIEDLRITNGLARYTTNFTPPVLPLNG
jgi:hypothetical protein